MVAPLIVGASRVVKGASKKIRPRKKTALVRREISKSIIDDERQRVIDNSEANIKNFRKLTAVHTDQNEKKLKKFIGIALTSVKRIKAAVASSYIFWTVIYFWVAQIAFWAVGLAGLGVEAIPFANYVLPGQTLFIVCHVFIIIIGITTMFYSLGIFLARRVNCFSGVKMLFFAICVAFYCAPFLNFAPWFVMWLASVVYFQGKSKDKQEEEEQ